MRICLTPSSSNLESPVFVAAAVLVFAALAISLWLSGAAALLVGAGVVALGAVVLDVREVAHQLDQGRPVIVLIAAVLVAVHLLPALGAAAALSAPRAGSS